MHATRSEQELIIPSLRGSDRVVEREFTKSDKYFCLLPIIPVHYLFAHTKQIEAMVFMKIFSLAYYKFSFYFRREQ